MTFSNVSVASILSSDGLSLDQIKFSTSYYKKKPIVVYHDKCLDGFTAAWCFWTYYKEHMIYEGANYNDILTDIDIEWFRGRTVFFVDFCFKPEVMIRILEVAKALVVLDHHKSAIERMEGFAEGTPWENKYVAVWDINRSGAGIAWDFLHDNDRSTRPVLLNAVEDRDLWRFKLEGTKDLNAYMFSHDYSFEQWDLMMLHDTATNQILNMRIAGQAIQRKHMKDIEELVSIMKRYMVIGDFSVPVCSLPYTMASEACHLMAKDYELGLSFAACYYDTASHRVFSLRSVEGIGRDVAFVAQKYGGGGHKHAAGFAVPRDHILTTS